MPSFARYESQNSIHFGLVEGDSITELQGGLFDPPQPTGRNLNLNAVRLLAPCTPTNVFAIGLNYRSHLKGRPEPSVPGVFLKPVSSVQNPGGPIVLPPQSDDVHFEGELVVVIGAKLSRATREQAQAAIFGVTCGNDVSERGWQKGENKDLQWWRAKGSDTFAPFGPVIVTGLNYGDLALETKLNGDVLQAQRTSDLIFDIPEIVRFISQWATLQPGDIIFTGTPGNTQKMKAGDVVEVTIEGIGTLRNPVE